MSLRVQKPGRPRSRVIAQAHPDRPPIWVDGRQRPPFDMKAFLRASVANARAASAQGLDAGARHAATAAPHLPRLAAGTQSLCAGAAGSLRGHEPEDDADTRVITAVLASAFPRTPAPPPAPAQPTAISDPTLAAIRAVLRDDAALARPPVPAPRVRRGPAARLLAMLSVAVLLPFGAASALYAHLAGEDLRLSG